MNASLLSELLAAGTPVDLVAKVAQALSDATADQRAVERRRASDASRQQARRDRVKDASSRDVTVSHVTSRDKCDETPSPNKAPQTPKINPNPCVCVPHAHEAAIPGHAMPRLLSLQLAVFVASLTASRATALNTLWNGAPPPPGVSSETWAGWLAHRRGHPKAGKITDYAYRRFTQKLAKLSAETGWPPGDLIDLAIDSNWVTVWPPKDFRHDNTSRHPARYERPSAWAPRPGMAGLEPASLDD